MRRIAKGPEPAALIEARADTSTTAWEELPSDCKQALRDGLVRDQGALCCYCQRRIRPSSDRMKIEHFAPRSTAPDRVFDWANLHGSCSGGEGLPPRLQTCDTRKGDRSCALDPLSIRDEDFTYDGAGRIRHVAAQQELDETLNLNARNLVRARKGRWVGYAQGFERRNKRWTRRSLEKELQRLDPENGPLDEFAGMYSSWLRRKLRRQG